MRGVLLTIVLLLLIVVPVSAMEYTAPAAPQDAQKYMPEDTESFADGLWFVIKSALSEIRPELAETAGICLYVICAVILTSTVQNIGQNNGKVVEITGVVIIGILLLQPSNTLIQLGSETIQQLNAYGKLLIPVLTAAVAAQGGVTTASALYAGTVFFNTILSHIITKLIIPIVYVYLCVSVAYRATDDQLLKNIQSFLKWAATWCLKTVLYVFIGYIGITGVVSGTTDAATLRAAKLTISGAVPVVGGILSDASEAVLVGVSVMKNAAGIYGLLAVISIGIGPFLKIAIPYLLLKVTGAISSTFTAKRSNGLINDLTTAMGLVLGIVGAMCLLLVISVVCFMKGIS